MAKTVKSNQDWASQLNAEQYRVCRGKGTEQAFSGKYWDCKETGIYRCVACAAPLFSSQTIYDSGSGWPSFYQPLAVENVTEHGDKSQGMYRTEVVCSQCDSHLGHVFQDGPTETGLRYCINSASLQLDKPEE
ncbi:MAG: peptide-methionine (R)-S-oxide reductase MsrB [Gammaproteobacteria bacterium]|nr:peptide-methionine (R)-S-oxide reductase MsrB [Gammaproteobacteria bacterium]